MGIVLDQIKSFRATDNLATVCLRSVSEPLCDGVRLQFAMALCIQMCFDTSNNNFSHSYRASCYYQSFIYSTTDALVSYLKKQY